MEARYRRTRLAVAAVSIAFGSSQAVPVPIFSVILGLGFAVSMVYLVISGDRDSLGFALASTGLIPAVGLNGFNAGIVFLSTGAGGVLIGWGAGKGLSTLKIVLLGAAPTFVLLALLVSTGGYGQRLEIYREQIESSIGSSIKQPGELDDSHQRGAEQERFLERITGIYLKMIPAIEVLSAIINSFIVYLLAAIALARFGLVFKPPPPFARWRLPEGMVYPFILGLILILLGRGWLRVAGINLAVILSVGYLLTGLAVVRYFFQRRAVPVLLQWLSFVALIFIQPFGALFAWVLGLFDIRFNFRRL